MSSTLILYGRVLVGIIFIVFFILPKGASAEFDLQAHRGGKGTIPPGNFIPAFLYAYELGVTTIELDTRTGIDNTIVVIHDEKIPSEYFKPCDERKSSMDLTIRKLSNDLIKGFCYTKKLGPNNFPGLTETSTFNLINDNRTFIPTLEEVFAVFKGKDVLFNIEMKHAGYEKKLINLIKQYNLESSVIIQSFKLSVLKNISSINNNIRLSALTDNNDIDLVDVLDAEASIWSPNYHEPNKLSSEKVDAAHSMGLQVIPYTVNRIKDLEYLIDIGVDGVITDYPNKFKDILENKQIAY